VNSAADPAPAAGGSPRGLGCRGPVPVTPAGKASPGCARGAPGPGEGEPRPSPRRTGAIPALCARFRPRLFSARFGCLHASLAEISAIIYSAFRDAFTLASSGNVVNTAQSQCSYRGLFNRKRSKYLGFTRSFRQPRYLG